MPRVTFSTIRTTTFPENNVPVGERVDFYINIENLKITQGTINLVRNLVQVLSVAKLEFSKILVPRLIENISNVNIESTGKSNNCIIYVTSILEPWYIFMLLFWY